MVSILFWHTPCFSGGTSKIRLKFGWYLDFVSTYADGWRQEFTIVAVTCRYPGKELLEVFQDWIPLQPRSEKPSWHASSPVCEPPEPPLPSAMGQSSLPSPFPEPKDDRKLPFPQPCALYACTISRINCRGRYSGERTSICSPLWDRPHPCNGWKAVQNLHCYTFSLTLMFTA